jgi:hypothetical protein
MARDKERNRSSNGRSRSLLHYDNLEPRWLLALASVPVSMHDDVFARGAVTVDHIMERAAAHEFMPNQIVVAVDVPMSRSQAPQFTSTIDWRAWTGRPVVQVISTMMTMARGTDRSASLIHLDIGPGSNPLAVVQHLSANQQVLWSSPNFVHTGDDPREFTPNDPQYSQQYHHPLMKNNLAWDITLGNPFIKIGVTDDGVLISHVDLNANIWVNPGEIPGNGIDDDGNGYIDDVNGWNFSGNNNDPNPNGSSNDHGTHVAGIAAGRTNNGIGIAGTAGLSTIVPLQFYNGGGAWTATVINNTYTYAANMGFQIVTTSYNVDGWVGDPVFLAGLQYMYNAGVLHFNSAGNNNQLNPARQVFDQSLFVSSTDSNDIKSSFTNYGTGIDVAAPGSSILSTVLNNGYGTKSGTSMSTPNAAGAAALIWGANPNWNRYQVAAQLLYFVDNIDNLNPNFAGLLGTGRVNPFKALTNTLPAPQIKSLLGLPPAGSTTATWNVSSFTVAFNQVMAPSGANNSGNYVLREAGLDGVFGTADDQIIGVTATKTYQVGTNLLPFNINGGALGPGRYQLSLLSNGLRNPFNIPLDGDGNGTGGDNFTYEFTLEPTTVKMPAFGSLIHEQVWSANIGAAGQTSDYFLSLDPGQTLSVISQPTGSLVPTIQVRNPAGTLIGTSSLVGNSSVVSSLLIPTAGRYRITFGGSGSSTGVFNARVLLNADIERESLGGPTNNSLATAQNLDGTAVSLGTRGADRLGVVGAMPSSTGTVVLSENFESGSLNSNWTTFSSVAQGRIRIQGTPSTASGSFAMIMDVGVNNLFNLNEATWTVNLAGLDSPTLRFWEASFADEVHTMPASFTGSSNSDGVAISANGTTWYRVWSPTTTQTSGVWTQRTVDLAAAAASAGITLGANFRIRFQQYDNYPVSTDGRGYDDITISVPAPQVDWYSFTLADGEYASVVGSRTGTTGTHQVDLYNSAGTLVASGTSAANASSMISRFQDTTTNGIRDTYYLRVSGSAENYSLIVTRNSDFDREANDTLGSAQDISNVRGALGYANTTPDFYRVSAANGELLSFSAFLPGGGADLFVNGLSSGGSSLFRMELVNPSGTTVASGISDVSFTANASGNWSLRVFAQSGGGGEYFVQRNVASTKVSIGTVALVGVHPVQVSFDQAFVDPIVIVSPPKNVNNHIPLIVSAANVTSTGFQMYISNWNGDAEFNIFEEVSYTVVERGVTSLPNGNYLVAGSLQVADGGFVNGTFSQSFTATPVIVPTMVGNLTSPPRAVRFNNINGSSFQVRTQFNEAGFVSADDIVTVNYMAMLPGRYTIENLTIEAGLTANTVTHQPFNLTFQQPFGGTPVFVANIQTFNDADPAVLRLNSLSATNANFFIQEETSFDPETQHGNEQVGYIALYRGNGDSFGLDGSASDLTSFMWLPDLGRDGRSESSSSDNDITPLQWPTELFGKLLLEEFDAGFGQEIELAHERSIEPSQSRSIKIDTFGGRNAKVDSFFGSFDSSFPQTLKSRLV